MSKKSFTGVLNTMLGEVQEPDAPKKKKGSRPTTSTSKTEKATQEARESKPKEIRATFIVREDLLEQLKDLAYWNRVTIKDVLNTFLQEEKLGNFAKHLTTQAKVPHRWEFVHDHIGYNYRMPNINAALGCAQLEEIDHILANKRETAEKYKQFFSDKENIQFFTEPEGSKSNYWLNAVLLNDKEAQLKFLEYTNDHAVMTRPVWELMNRLPMFKDCETDGLQNTVWFADRVVNIPSSFRFE